MDLSMSDATTLNHDVEDESAAAGEAGEAGEAVGAGDAGATDAEEAPASWPTLALVAYLVAFTAFALWLQFGAPGQLEAIERSTEAHAWHVVMVIASVKVLAGWLPVFIGLSVVLGALFIDRKRRARVGQICAGLFALVIVVGFTQLLVLAMAAASAPPATEGTPVPAFRDSQPVQP